MTSLSRRLGPQPESPEELAERDRQVDILVEAARRALDKKEVEEEEKSALPEQISGHELVKLLKGDWTCACGDIGDGMESFRAHLASVAQAAPPSVDGLEAQCYKVIDAWDLRYGRLDDSDCLETIARFFAKFIRSRDRELVELAAKWDKENSLRSDDSYRYPQQLRAVLAARNEGGATK